MMSTPPAIVRGSILVGIRDAMAARKIDVRELLLEAGIRPDALDHPTSELPLDEVAQLMEMAADRAEDPAFGLSLAEAYPMGANGLLDYLMQHAATVREALETATRFAALLYQPSSLTFREEPGAAKLSWCFATESSTRRIQFAIFANAVLVLRLKRIAGRDWYPLAVEVEHPDLPCRRKLHRILGPTVTFNGRENTIVIDPAVLKRKCEGADPRLYQILRESGEAKLMELASRPDVVTRAGRAIIATLGTETPLLENIAERMRMSPRTLQSRLAQHGTTFERLLTETRRNLAERYLRDTDLPLTEIAFLLGFSEQSSFTRAARGWFGMPPRRLRKEGILVQRNRETEQA